MKKPPDRGYSTLIPLHVYKINEGNIGTFVRFPNDEQGIKEIWALLQAYTTLLQYIEENNLEMPDRLTEIWQTPIPFSRTLAYATLFRLNPYDCAYLVSPVRMPWLESSDESITPPSP